MPPTNFGYAGKSSSSFHTISGGTSTSWIDVQRIVPFGTSGPSTTSTDICGLCVLASSAFCDRDSLRPYRSGGPGVYGVNLPWCSCGLFASAASASARQASIALQVEDVCAEEEGEATRSAN